MLQEHSLGKKSSRLISSSPNVVMHCFTRSLSSSSGEKREDHLSVTHVDSSHNFYDEHRPTHGPHDHLSAPGEKLHLSAQRTTNSGPFPPVRQNLHARIHNPVCQQRVIGQSSNLPVFVFNYFLRIFTLLFYQERTSCPSTVRLHKIINILPKC